MKHFLVLLTVCFLLISTQSEAGLRGRDGYGPVTMSAASTCYPSDSGFTVTAFDGDMTVSSLAIGGGTLAWTIQTTTFKESEDSGNNSFVSVTPTPHTLTQTVDTIKGPIERMRFCTTTCTGDCTMKVKVQGRIAP